MSYPDLTFETTEMRQRVLSRRENEGGPTTEAAFETSAETPDLTNTELVHLRMRVIALENLMIAFLAEGSDPQRQLELEMGNYSAPRAVATQYPLTVQASHHMTDLVHRADHFRAATFATNPYKSTPIFDETLPAGLRKEHRTEADVLGVIRVLEERLRYWVLEPESETILDPENQV